MKILLVEPAYKNKYPPLGLMKISTYHKNRGDSVLFYKGDMPQEFLSRYAPDRVYITSLFTFDYKQTVKTIKHYQRIMPPNHIYVGGIMATLMTNKLCNDIGNESIIITGQLISAKMIGLNDKTNIDACSLDYAILDDVAYKYPAGNNFFAYATRGCTNKCKFCAVPVLEPEFKLTNNISQQIRIVRERFGDKKDLLLLDNNILSLDAKNLRDIVSDIKNLGYEKGKKFIPPFPLRVFLKKLDAISRDHPNFDTLELELLAYLKSKVTFPKSIYYQERYEYVLSLIEETEDKYSAVKKHQNELLEILGRYCKSQGSRRCVDFNQGIDARQLTPEKMEILSQIPIEPFRLAFDSMSYKDIYIRSVKIAREYGVRRFSNYILYNFEERPEELWQRLQININLAKQLGISIFSFPMKYAPIDETDRKYVGQFWNKYYLKNIYGIINVTKGIVADGESFFYKAFGHCIKDYFELLSMPRNLLIYRKYFENNGVTIEWQREFRDLSDIEKKELLDVLNELGTPKSTKVIEILKYYKMKKRLPEG